MRRNIKLSMPQFMSILIITIIGTFLTTTITVLGSTGTTDASNPPHLTYSYDLNDLYDRLDYGGTSVYQNTFSGPWNAPGTGTMHTINDIMSIIPAPDYLNGAEPGHVLEGKTFWGLNTMAWGNQTGTMPIRDNFTGTNADITFAIPDGYYKNKTATAADTNLIADNIRHGVTIFGITGNYKTGWSYYTTSTFRFRLHDIDMLTSTDAWAVDGLYAYHWNGITWSSAITLPDSARTVDMLATNDVWAVGSADLFMHWDGSSWSSHATGMINETIYDIQMVNSNNGWAVGQNSRIYHYDGSTWSLHSTVGGGTATLNSLSMLSSSIGWAVDDYGRTFRWNGISWSLYADISSVVLTAIDMINSSDGWAVGRYGQIYHWNGSSWSLFADVNTDLETLDMLNSSEGWAAGDNGEIFHYDGTNWTLSTNAGSATINGIATISSSDGWAVNADGEFLVLRD